MDGNLLDADNADATLAKEWSLPELPADKSSLPSSSQELADIFGNSDDEDMEFPFSLNNVDKTFPHLSLPDGRDTEFFLNSLNSLSRMPVTLNTPSAEQLLKKKAPLDNKVPSDCRRENTKKATGDNDVGTKGVKKDSGAGRVNNGASSDGVKEDTLKEDVTAGNREDGEEKKEDEAVTATRAVDESVSNNNNDDPKPTGMTLRKSARVHRRLVSSDWAEVQSAQEVPESTVVPKSREQDEIGHKEVKLEEKEEPDISKKEEGKEEVSANINSGSKNTEESDEEEDSESDDPDRLWCICQQPHDDRFMICCDQCEEWYHGSCVGISVSQGRRMEREGKDYVCPICVEKEKQAKEEREMSRSARIGRRDVIKEKDLRRKSDSARPGVRRRSSSSVGADGGDQYGLSQLFQPDNAPKLPIKEEVITEDMTVRTKFKEEYTGSCIAPDCNKPTIPPSVYCGDACVEKHASSALKKLLDRGISFQSSPSEFVRGSGGVSVIEMATGKMLVGIAAPSQHGLVPWLKLHPSYQILLHKKGKGGGSKKKLKQGGVKKEEGDAPKMPKIFLMDPDSVRANAKKALCQILWKRCEDAADMRDQEQSTVEAIANKIEEKLHNLHQEINPKYKNKYRSLVFNLKDVKNQGLFRKVVLGEITPYELVRMSTEKLASKDLAQWREQTIKKHLELVKMREEEAGSLGKTIRKFTYKGEVEIDTADDNAIETVELKLDNTLAEGSSEQSSATSKLEPKLEPISKSEPNSKSKSSSKTQSDSTSSMGGILDLLDNPSGGSSSAVLNTTSQHGSHVYDQHCDICMGKTSSPPPSPRQQSSSSDAPSQSPESKPEPMDDTAETRSPVLDQAKSPPVLATQVVWKGFVNMSGLSKFATTAYPVSGPVDNIHELLPDTLHVMGRIAHVQVWDYMDKLRSSTTRDIVVLRFSCIDEELDSYMSMLTYLVKKHRCGVINCCFPGMKDMYLVPLQANAHVAHQLLPFSGPGLPAERKDLLLGLIVRSKVRKHRMNPQSPPSATEKITAEICIKRHHSASLDEGDTHPPPKRPCMAIEVGVGGETPPTLSGFQDDDYQDLTSPTDNTTPAIIQLSGGVASRSEKKEGKENSSLPLSSEQASQNVQMSFYGEHRPLPDPPMSLDINPLPKSGSKETSSLPSGPLSTSGDLSSILSQLSDEKLLKDLASAVSTITNKPPILAGLARCDDAGTPLHSRTSNAVPTSNNSVSDYGANTPPPEDVIRAEERRASIPIVPLQEKLPQVFGGPPFPQQIRPAGSGQLAVQPPPAQQQGGDRLSEWERDRERFANTPPPDFQPSFTYQQQAQEVPPYQRYHDSVDQRGHPHHYRPLQNQGPPHEYYNNYPPKHGDHYPQQQKWDLGQDRSQYDPRLRDHPHGGRGHNFPRGGRGGGNYPSYRHHGGRDSGRDKYHNRGERKYPKEWYRK